MGLSVTNACIISAPPLLPKTKGPKKSIFIVGHRGMWGENWRGWFCIPDTDARISKEISV